ncbi:MAG: hypothetical protein M5U34_00290 [Chloroflexi bacterium]|nr:hypothetical protein [Chloroflexota bacterium]
MWHIFFSGAPCVTSTTCDSNLFMGTEGGDYTINSDGSGFMPIADLPGMPTDINFVQFSPDGSQMAYTQYQDETRENRVIRLLNLDGSSPIDLGIQPSDWADIQFLPEPDCLAIFRRAGREDPLPEAETLTIEKWCVNQPPQLLEIVQFPELVPGWGYTWGDFKLSPDGNYLYGYSQEYEGNMALYLHRMGETSPLHYCINSLQNTSIQNLVGGGQIIKQSSLLLSIIQKQSFIQRIESMEKQIFA